MTHKLNKIHNHIIKIFYIKYNKILYLIIKHNNKQHIINAKTADNNYIDSKYLQRIIINSVKNQSKVKVFLHKIIIQ